MHIPLCRPCEAARRLWETLAPSHGAPPRRRGVVSASSALGAAGAQAGAAPDSRHGRGPPPPPPPPPLRGKKPELTAWTLPPQLAEQGQRNRAVVPPPPPPPPPQQQQQQQPGYPQQQYAPQPPQQQQQPAHQQPQQPAGPPQIDPSLRSKYAHTRVVARAPPLEPPPRPGALSPAAAAWFGRTRIPQGLLAAAGAGMVAVEHPQTRERVEAIGLPYYDASGRLVDVRYWTLGADGQLADAWLAHGVGFLYAPLPAVFSSSGDIAVAGDELSALALAAAGLSAVVAVPQRLPSWRADTVAYRDARARAQPLRDHLEALRKELELREAAEDAAERCGGGGGNSLAAALGLAPLGGGGGAAAPAAAAPAGGSRPGTPGKRKGARRAKRGAGVAAARQGLKLLVENADSAVLAFDASPSEQQLAGEVAGLLGAALCRGVSWPAEVPEWQGGGGAESARSGVLDVMERDGPEELVRLLQIAFSWPVEGIERFGDYGEQLLSAFEGRLEQQRAHSTGWPSVDEVFKVTPGELTLVTGVPNSGKSEWLDALAVSMAARHGWRFALCSLEKRPRDHARQLVEKIAGKPMLRAAYAGNTPRMEPQELDAAFDWLDRHFVVIHASDDAMPSLDWVLEKARAAVINYGVKGLILDPYNELDHSRPPGKNEHEYISEFMAKLRGFAKSYACHVFLVAHPKQRANWRGEAPNLMDISGGANFFAKCDNGIVVHRDWSQLRELRDTRRAPGRAAKAAGAQEPGAAGGGGGAQQGQEAAAQPAPQQPQHAPFLGFQVEIQVQKVRSKTTGQRGVAVLEYDAASGRYHELGRGPASAAAAAAASAAAGGAASVADAGVGASLAREGAEAGVEVEDVDELAELAVDEDLLGARRESEVLDFVGRRAAALAREARLAGASEVHDLAAACAAGGDGQDEEAREWLEGPDEVD